MKTLLAFCATVGAMLLLQMQYDITAANRHRIVLHALPHNAVSRFQHPLWKYRLPSHADSYGLYGLWQGEWFFYGPCIASQTGVLGPDGSICI